MDQPNGAFLRRINGVTSPRPCGGFLKRRYHQCCGFCFFPLEMHEFLEESTWSPAGPYIATYVLTPNPAYQPMMRESA